MSTPDQAVKAVIRSHFDDPDNPAIKQHGPSIMDRDMRLVLAYIESLERLVPPLEPTEAMLLAVDELRGPPMGPPEHLTAQYCERWRQKYRQAAVDSWKVMLAASEPKIDFPSNAALRNEIFRKVAP
jgi:hypothetical protein